MRVGAVAGASCALVVALTGSWVVTAAPAGAAVVGTTGSSITWTAVGDAAGTDVTVSVVGGSVDFAALGTVPATAQAPCSVSLRQSIECPRAGSTALTMALSGFDDVVSAGSLGTPYGVSVAAGAGSDHVYGSPVADVVHGDAGDDQLVGASGDDVLSGDDGSDLLTGGPGSDQLLGGPGDDVVEAADGAADVVDCGPGTDFAFVDPVDVVTGCEHVTGLPAFAPDVTLKAKARTAKGAKVKKLTVAGAVAGSTVTVTCAGHGCAFKSTTVTTATGLAQLASLFDARRLRSATVTVGVQHPGYVGGSRAFTISGRGKVKPGPRLCLAPGASGAVACG